MKPNLIDHIAQLLYDLRRLTAEQQLVTVSRLDTELARASREPDFNIMTWVKAKVEKNHCFPALAPNCGICRERSHGR